MCTRAWAAVYSEQSGVVERPSPTASGSRLAASHVRNVLNLNPAVCNLQSAFVLLDAAGRRVLDLHSGPSDVSALAPGAYFVQSTAGNRHATVGRVIVAR